MSENPEPVFKAPELTPEQIAALHEAMKPLQEWIAMVAQAADAWLQEISRTIGPLLQYFEQMDRESLVLSDEAAEPDDEDA